MYGGGPGDLRPQHVTQWHIATEFQINNTSPDDYMPINITVSERPPNDYLLDTFQGFWLSVRHMQKLFWNSVVLDMLKGKAITHVGLERCLDTILIGLSQVDIYGGPVPQLLCLLAGSVCQSCAS